MAVEPRLITAEELMAMADDGTRRELVRGEIRTMSPTGIEHGSLMALISASLVTACRRHRQWRVVSGDPGFRLGTNPDTLRCPDVAVLPRSHQEDGPNSGFHVGPPTIAIEIVSPTDLYSDVEEKVLEYLASGTAVVFVVSSRSRRASEYRQGQRMRILTTDDALEAEDILPGWKLPLRELFDES